jgi:hypothetical protein
MNNKLSKGGMTHDHIQNNVQNWTAFADPTTYIEAMRIIQIQIPKQQLETWQC